MRWCGAAGQVVDAVGLYCYEPSGPNDATTYRKRAGVPTEMAIERTLYKACLDLSQLKP